MYSGRFSSGNVISLFTGSRFPGSVSLSAIGPSSFKPLFYCIFRLVCSYQQDLWHLLHLQRPCSFHDVQMSLHSALPHRRLQVRNEKRLKLNWSASLSCCEHSKISNLYLLHQIFARITFKVQYKTNFTFLVYWLNILSSSYIFQDFLPPSSLKKLIYNV